MPTGPLCADSFTESLPQLMGFIVDATSWQPARGQQDELPTLRAHRLFSLVTMFASNAAFEVDISSDLDAIKRVLGRTLVSTHADIVIAYLKPLWDALDAKGEVSGTKQAAYRVGRKTILLAACFFFSEGTLVVLSLFYQVYFN